MVRIKSGAAKSVASNKKVESKVEACPAPKADKPSAKVEPKVATNKNDAPKANASTKADKPSTNASTKADKPSTNASTKADKSAKNKKSDDEKTDRFPSRVLNTIKKNTINAYINGETEKLDIEKEKPKVSAFRSNKIRIGEGCSDVFGDVLTKAVSDLFNIAAQQALSKNRKTIEIDHLFANHGMLKSKYSPLFVNCPEYYLSKEEVTEGEGDDAKVKQVWNIEKRDRAFVHFTDKKFKGLIKDLGNDKKGKPIKMHVSEEFKLFINNLLLSACNDFAYKLELFLVGAKLKTVTKPVVRVLLQMLLSSNVTHREDSAKVEQKEDNKVSVNVTSKYKLANGDNLEDLL